MTDPQALTPYDPEEEEPPVAREASPRSRGVALAVGAVLGIFGCHRFYVGKVQTGLLQLITLGGIGLWWLYDLILIGAGEFTDVAGRPLRNWAAAEVAGDASGESAQVARLSRELDGLRAHLSELQERMDFAERILAQQRERGRLAP